MAVHRQLGRRLAERPDRERGDALLVQPSNRLELWAYLESERFTRPVFREFYKERDVVMEERNMRVETNREAVLGHRNQGGSYLYPGKAK